MMQSAGIVVNDVTVTWRNGHTASAMHLDSTGGDPVTALVANGS